MDHSSVAGRVRPGVRRLGRMVLAAAAHALFAGAALAVLLVAVPAIRLCSPRAEVAERRVQRVYQRGLRAYLGLVEALGLARFRCRGEAALREPGTLVVANHPTHLDALALIRFMPQVDCLVKQEYFDHPLLGALARAAGYLPNSGGRGVVDGCVSRLLRGRSVLIFPEGTRSPRSGLSPLRRGAAHVALESGHDLLPVTVRCAPPLLAKGEPWWRIADAGVELSLEVGAPIRLEPAVADAPNRARAARALTESIRQHFEARTCGVGSS